MLKNLKEPREVREAMLSLLPTCGTLAGIAVGLVGVINLRPAGSATSVADELLVFSALGFLVACYLIFFAMRTSHEPLRLKMMRALDAIFLGSLTLVVFSGFVVVYEFI